MQLKLLFLPALSPGPSPVRVGGETSLKKNTDYYLET
jgi:hypothetical protein